MYCLYPNIPKALTIFAFRGFDALLEVVFGLPVCNPIIRSELVGVIPGSYFIANTVIKPRFTVRVLSNGLFRQANFLTETYISRNCVGVLVQAVSTIEIVPISVFKTTKQKTTKTTVTCQ